MPSGNVSRKHSVKKPPCLLRKKPTTGPAKCYVIHRQTMSGSKLAGRNAGETEIATPRLLRHCGLQIRFAHASFYGADRLHQCAKFLGIGGKRVIGSTQVLIQSELFLHYTSAQGHRANRRLNPL